MSPHRIPNSSLIELLPFPDERASSLRELFQLTASIALDPQALKVVFHLRGKLQFAHIPLSTLTPSFRDELWRSTCFEVFVGHEGQTGYLEVNAASTGHYAYYFFKDYRANDSHPIEAAVEPKVVPRFLAHNDFMTELTIPRSLIEEAIPRFTVRGLRIGLSTVLESHGKTISYWAVTHAGKRPDFHDARSFTLQLRH